MWNDKNRKTVTEKINQWHHTSQNSGHIILYNTKRERKEEDERLRLTQLSITKIWPKNTEKNRQDPLIT